MTAVVAMVALLTVVSGLYLATFVPATWYWVLTLAMMVFSGHGPDLGLPTSPDRVALGLAIVVSIVQRRRGELPGTIRWQTVHWLLLGVAIIATFSAWQAGTLATQDGAYALLDRLGLVPFLLFVLAPIVFRTEKQRRALLVGLILTGAYLGVTALLEGVGLKSLALPHYINDPNVGIHFDRARGPFTEAVADGMALYTCAVAAAIGAYIWAKRRRLAIACLGISALCALGTLFTLTRAVWIGAALGTVATLLLVKQLRRFAVPVIGAGLLAVLVALVFVPGLAGNASERASEQRPLWDRLNSDAAALRVVEQKPLTGVGWSHFVDVNPDYVRQADTYPITGTNIEVHNVFLGRAAEIGLPGAFLYVAALAAALGGALLRRGPPELLPWKVGLIGIAVMFLFCANFGPVSYAMANATIWLWAGVVMGPTMLAPEERRESDTPAVHKADALESREALAV